MLLEAKLPQYPHLEALLVQDEKDLIETLLKELDPLKASRPQMAAKAKGWIEDLRKRPLHTFDVQRFLQTFPLTNEEGRSLMALSEAYLRIPDVYTANLLLKDKISGRTWRKTSEGTKEEPLIQFSRWGLDVLSYLQNHAWGAAVEPFKRGAFKGFVQLILP